MIVRYAPALTLAFLCSLRTSLPTHAWLPVVPWGSRRPRQRATPTIPGVRWFPSILTLQTTSTPTTTDAPVLSLFNSKTRAKEPFRPVRADTNVVSMYTCGPTVYDFAHVGNFRAFLTYDVLKRVLRYLGYHVTHVCNLTDVDDKIIQRANEQKIDHVQTLTRRYEQHFRDDLQALNIQPACQYPRATEHIDDMMDLIRVLRDKELAYETPDGSWYFRTQAQPRYGTQLVQLNYQEMAQTERGESDDKEHFADFCLWKAFKTGVDRMDAAWESNDIALGRPGWHLECSAMARHFFGDDTIDLHGGGIDLKFPHHENEIAQSEGATGNVFCNCWFHNGFVNMDNEKMSKSLGNFLTLRGACPTPDDVRAYRYLAVSSQYRQALAFTPQAMTAARNAIARMDKIKNQLEECTRVNGASGTEETMDSELHAVARTALENFEVAICDDLSMPRASAALFSLVKAAEGELKRVNKVSDDEVSLDYTGLRRILDAMKQMDQVFGIFYRVPVSEEEETAQEEALVIPDDVVELVERRTAAKEAKDWELADALRSQVTELGYAVKDVKGEDPIVTQL
jgi:cysteinyl-tRNA synthetase